MIPFSNLTLMRMSALLMTSSYSPVSTEPEAAVSQVEASKGSVLEMIEAAYPNPVTLDTMCRYSPSPIRQKMLDKKT